MDCSSVGRNRRYAKYAAELIESTLPTTLRTTPSTPDTGGDLDGAACDSSAGYISPGTTCEEQEQTQRASSRNRSPIDSTVESSCTRLPDNDDVAITQQSYEPTAHTVSLVCSQRDFDSKGPSKDDDKLHCQGPSSKPLRKRDSISLEKAGSDSGNNSSQEGSNGGDDSSDVDGNDNGDESDESDESSGTANDDAASGGHGSRRCDSDNSPSETDKEKERPSNISSDNESDNNCHRPRKRRRVTKDQESDQTRRAKVHRAESRSCSLPVQSLSRQSRRAGVGFAPSPPTSHDMSGLETESDEDGIVQPTASFSEWQLHDATLKSVMINGITTYQLLFKRACRAKARQVSHEKPKSCSQTKDFHGWPSQERGRRVRFSAEEDELIIELKEKLGLSWTEIYDRCSTTFVRRSKEALQVRYCTKLKGRR